MKKLNLVACCMLFLGSAGTLSAYYYQSGYYDRGDEGAFVTEASLQTDTGRAIAQTYDNPYTTGYTLSGTDSATAAKIHNALAALPAGKNVNISVTNGRVTVTGLVTNTTEKYQIASAIRKVSGVTSVNNQIQISK